MFRRKPEVEDRYEFDESIFKPKPDVRVRLPGDVDVVYEEEQAFDQIWLWAIMGIELLIVMVPLILTGQSWWTFLVAVGAIVLGMALLGSIKLTTRIDSTGVHYRMKVFHWKEQTIPWEEIDQIYVRKYSPIGEYGGWGIRYGRGGRAFNVRGNYGIQVVKKNGKRILLGTQKPDEAALHLSQHPLLV
jgi:hypothetical protein